MTDRLAGRVAIVTGGARGIGLALATGLASDGAHVMIADMGAGLDGTGRDESVGAEAASRIREQGGTCAHVATDVTDDRSIDQLVGRTVEQFGGFDILVNAAGNLRAGTVADMTVDDLEASLRVHVRGTARTMRAAIQHWRSSAGSHRRVVNVSSESGLFGDGPYAAYGAAKGAVIALTLGAVAELSQVGATAQVLIPQAATRMTASIPADMLGDAGTDKWSAGGEYDPSNVAPLVQYLAGDESDWLNGRIVGGWGHEVHLYCVPTRARSAFRDRPWTTEALAAQLPRVFGES